MNTAIAIEAMQNTQLDFVNDNSKAGFRLFSLEVLNWGTFGQCVWELMPAGDNTLLTGDIGSGKSTLVDAITSLLVPHHRIIYNRAAGAESKERSLYSYIRGEFKNTKEQDSVTAKSVYLRDEKSYTVLLAYFYNEGYAQGITLAQVFWLKNQEKNPERFFVIAQGFLTITEHFSGFGSDITSLKKRLKKIEALELYEQFKEYSQRFRQLFGIQSEQALDLFYQTVSMKSVGNLTDFVRQHMLEKTNVLERIESLKQNFENLNRAHEAVLKVKKQIECLEPLITELKNYDDYNQQLQQYREARDLLETHFAKQKTQLLRLRLNALTLDQKKIQQKLEQCQIKLVEFQGKAAQLKTDIDENGGKRLHIIEQELQQLEHTKNKLFEAAKQYQALCQCLTIAYPDNQNAFIDTQDDMRKRQKNLEQEHQALQDQQVVVKMQVQACRQKISDLDIELTSLKMRKSNIPAKNLVIRDALCVELNLDIARLPFVGELLQIASEERVWEGAAERVLHNFGLSLLVSDECYELVSHYVDRTHLRGKLVYYRVKVLSKNNEMKKDKTLLSSKMLIKPDSKFYAWLQQELHLRFDYVCCEALQEFRRATKAITQQGQTKSPGERHEKDDRYDLFDRSRYILGWSNQEKIQVLEKQKLILQTEGDGYIKNLENLYQKCQQIQERRDACRDILSIQFYADIDWQSVANAIQILLDEKTVIEKSSDILHVLQQQLQQVQNHIGQTEQEKGSLHTDIGKLTQQQAQFETDMASAELLCEEVSEDHYQRYSLDLEKYQLEALSEKQINLVNIDKSKTQVREFIQAKIDSVGKKCHRLTESIIARMQTYKKDYPAETMEIDANLAASKEYHQILTILTAEDLPRHEARFKELLNEGTINGIVLLQNQLNKEKQDIENKISRINQSLHDIEYNTQLGTYIKLVIDQTQDVEVREFQQALRECLSHTTTTEVLYDENKFLQVKALITRFQGGKDQAEADKRWVMKVTDVRNWFSFSVSECFFEDDSQHEFYSDSSGKSGGQKEKLAYTVLASALAYQFGLEWNVQKSRSFRFVVIDEAFGRGSDESTRYGMELFKKLNLQLMIVTPLQKINVIENYVNTVHYVHNYEGKNSVIRSLSIQEYQRQKAEFLETIV